MDRKQRKLTEIAKRIEHLLTKKGWTQQQLADKSGLKKSYISGLLHCHHNPTIETIATLEDALHAPILITPQTK